MVSGERKLLIYRSRPLLISFVLFLLGCCGWFIRDSSVLSKQTQEQMKSLNNNVVFPEKEHTMELLRISTLMYDFHSYKEYFTNCTRMEEYLNFEGVKNYTCYLYENDSQHTQVIVVANLYHEWIGVIYAGTDDYQNVFTDMNILDTAFCTSGNHANVTCRKQYYNPHVTVHEGFYNSVFKAGLYSTLVDTILHKAKKDHPNFSIVTSGHSLGAAASVLTAVAFRTMSTQDFINDDITSINFGCPYTGNGAWYKWVKQEVDRVQIFRYVNEEDVVPRLPIGFSHVGHTLQITNKTLVKAYYYHYGDKHLRYAGVPFGWETYSILTSPIGTMQHKISSYKSHLKSIEKASSSNIFVDHFEEVETFRMKSGNYSTSIL